MSAFVRGIGVRPGPDRVVVVTGIVRVDRHQGNFAQIRSASRRNRSGAFGFENRFAGKIRRNPVRVNGDEADRFWLTDRAEALDDLRPRSAKSASRLWLDDHEVAVA
jgi:hypothetical protein